METTKEWVKENDPYYRKHLASFTTSNLKHDDSAFEFVFLNLAMQKYSPNGDTPKGERRDREYKAGARSYLVLPKFISSSATSFEKFASSVTDIIKVIDGLDDRVSVMTMHPEDIDADKRSPSPVIILQWLEEV